MVVVNGARALVKTLEKQGVKVIFGIPGGAVLDICEALADSSIRTILTRHEQCAAHAADGYARASGQVGVCLATSGPGATNLVTGIATAYMDSSPIVAFTGQVPMRLIGRDAFQEVDIIGITCPITKHNFQVERASDIPLIVEKAFRIASSGRPGPVLVDIPKNVQIELFDVEFDGGFEVAFRQPNHAPHPLQVKKAVDLLASAESPMIIAGGGVIASNASQELLAVAELLMAPVATTLMGKGAIPENHPLATGLLGMHGTVASNRLIQEADVVLAVGMRFSDRTTGKLEEFCSDAKIIHIEVDAAEIGKNIEADVPIVADAKQALQEIYKLLKMKVVKRERTALMAKIKELKEQLEGKANCERELKPPRLMVEIRRVLPENAIITTEVGQNQMWAALYLKVYKPRTFISSGGLGTMGFGFPAALGAKVACPEVPVVDIAGDGSFIMTEQDLATSVEENIPVTIVVLNNSLLGMVAQWQRLFYNRRYFAVNLGKVPDFVKLAEAYGAQGFRVKTLEEFSSVFKKALQSSVTTVIDVPILPEENVLPMVPPGKGLKWMIWE
ncbi:MAG: biosynthetic-type acetolactate synthase large subunit [Candidatus Bathyarchaeota archaeon]|nr:biosynthetic-type acetolactate synthase large subunit [Candidatus Bathyarchaeota archaeon]MDW8022967.1 biosynthetic-type acetolactate synthase large subunit [Nitrososphaerota archaeon]MDW8041083.1 biosynthetic-type acetolactate synthase large subunit [Nitrososphaerota archaeon]